MGLSLEKKVLLTARSDRVKCVDIHPQEPWMLCSLYSGKVSIWNFETETMIKSIEVCEMPVRTAKFIPRKNWIVTGADDLIIRVFNYNTMEKVTQFDAHGDYIRDFAIHPTKPYVLSCSDDMTIKLWDWEKGWKCSTTFEGHCHYVMSVVINPKDPNIFASASLDRTIKVWSYNSAQPNYTLEGHDKGINCVAYFPGNDRPYLVSASDDSSIKVWDFQTKACIKSLEGHSQNLSSVIFHAELPIMLSGSEDGTIKVWNTNTFRLEATYNFALDRFWALAVRPGAGEIAVGADDGAVVFRLGKGEPAASMDPHGKIVWAKNNEILAASIKQSLEEAPVSDGERILSLSKDLGQCEMFPQSLHHSPNGRFVAVLGEGEYIVYSALGWRSKAFGRAKDLAWSHTSNEYALLESSTRISIQQDFASLGDIQLGVTCEGLFGGRLIGVALNGGQLSFFDWTTCDLVNRIDVEAKKVYWSEDGTKVAILSPDSIYILHFDESVLMGSPGEDGFDGAFTLIHEVDQRATSGIFIGDAFVFISANNQLSYVIGQHVSRIAACEKSLYVVGFVAGPDRVMLVDKDASVYSYEMPLSVVQFEARIISGDHSALHEDILAIPEKLKSRMGRFLQEQGFIKEALELTSDIDVKFDLAVQLGNLDLAFDLAKRLDSISKWRDLGDLALKQWKVSLAEQCYLKCDDLSSLLLLYSSCGNVDGLCTLARIALERGINNIAFTCLFAAGKKEDCFELLLSCKKYPEAAMFARSYVPSAVNTAVDLWKQSLSSKNSSFANAILSPDSHPDAFPDINEYYSTTITGKLSPANVSHPPPEQHPPQRSTSSATAVKTNRTPSCSGSNSSNNYLGIDITSSDTAVLPSPYEVAFSDHMSMEVNTGTGSMRADDLDDLASLAASETRDDAPSAARALERLSIKELEEEHLFSTDETDPFKIALKATKSDFFDTENKDEPVHVVEEGFGTPLDSEIESAVEEQFASPNNIEITNDPILARHEASPEDIVDVPSAEPQEPLSSEPIEQPELGLDEESHKIEKPEIDFDGDPFEEAIPPANEISELDLDEDPFAKPESVQDKPVKVVKPDLDFDDDGWA